VALPLPQSGPPLLQITDLVRSYQGLRPLRLSSLILTEGERVAIQGVDAAGAEVLVNLITGAALPEKGEVRVFGRATSEISNGDEWLTSLDRFGIVSPRAVVMEGATVQQNLAMPYTLEIDPVPADISARVEALARETGIETAWLAKPVAETPANVRLRLHFARAVALDPSLVLLEHPTHGIASSAVTGLADDVRRVLEGRKLTALVMTQDETFASRVAHRTLRLQPTTGELKPVRKGWFR
jgi:ABC-type lipoprotein export system ATPase subunit